MIPPSPPAVNTLFHGDKFRSLLLLEKLPGGKWRSKSVMAVRFVPMRGMIETAVPK